MQPLQKPNEVSQFKIIYLPTVDKRPIGFELKHRIVLTEENNNEHLPFILVRYCYGFFKFSFWMFFSMTMTILSCTYFSVIRHYLRPDNIFDWKTIIIDMRNGNVCAISNFYSLYDSVSQSPVRGPFLVRKSYKIGPREKK
jgi:hypothetical protein